MQDYPRMGVKSEIGDIIIVFRRGCKAEKWIRIHSGTKHRKISDNFGDAWIQLALSVDRGSQISAGPASGRELSI